MEIILVVMFTSCGLGGSHSVRQVKLVTAGDMTILRARL